MTDKKQCSLRMMVVEGSPLTVRPHYSWSCACGETEKAICQPGDSAWEIAFQSYVVHRTKTAESNNFARDMEQVQIRSALRASIGDKSCCGQAKGKICGDCPNLGLKGIG